MCYRHIRCHIHAMESVPAKLQIRLPELNSGKNRCGEVLLRCALPDFTTESINRSINQSLFCTKPISNQADLAL